jgi:hypothetical protein
MFPPILPEIKKTDSSQSKPGSHFVSYSEWKGGDENKVGYPWGSAGHEGGEFIGYDFGNRGSGSNLDALNSIFSGNIEALDTNPNLEPLNDLYPAPPQQWKDQPRSLDDAMNNWTNGPGASQLNQAEDTQALKNAQFGSDLGSFQPTTGDTQVLDYVDSVANNNPPTQGELQDIYKNTGLKENGPYGNQPYYSPPTPIPQEGGLFSQRERESGQWQQYGNVIVPPPPTATPTPTPTQAVPVSNPTQTTPASNFTQYNAAPSNRAPMWNESSIWSPQAAQAGSSSTQPTTWNGSPISQPQSGEGYAPPPIKAAPMARQEAGNWYPGYEVPTPSAVSLPSRRSGAFGWGAPDLKANSWTPTPFGGGDWGGQGNFTPQTQGQNSWGTTQTNMWGL